MTNHNFALQGSPYYRMDSSIQTASNATRRIVAAFDALKKEHAGITPCDRGQEYAKLYKAIIDLDMESGTLRERVVTMANFEGVRLEGA